MRTSHFYKSVLSGLIIVIIIKCCFNNFSFVGLLALFVFFQQLTSLFLELGTDIPYRALFGTMMALQMLVGPSLVYNGLEGYQIYKMAIGQEEYFYYVLPATIFFIIGLNIWAKKKDGQLIDLDALAQTAGRNKKVSFYLIAIGFIGSLMNSFVPADLAFVFYLLGMLKFMGLFILILSNEQVKLPWLVLIYGSIILSSLNSGMFHDLLTWTIILGAVLCYKYKFSNKAKIISLFAFIFITLFIQIIKQGYRQKSGMDTGKSNLELLNETQQEVSRQKGDFFNIEIIAPTVTRINQGWIIASIMNRIPEFESFAYGETLVLYLEAAFLPRFLAPEKLNAGDRELFMKYSGIELRQGTSMALSSVGDAYINFGVGGGWVFMFLYGYLFNFFLKQLGKLSKYYPVLILFASIIFIYPIRPDCELQTILGHLIKSSFFILVIFKILSRYFKIPSKYFLFPRLQINYR